MAVDRLGVTGEVLDGRGDIKRASRTRGLKAADVRGAQGRGQLRFLGPGLVGSAPPVVAGKILNGGKVPHPAGGSQRLPGSGTAGFSSRWIPRSAHADRLREERRLPGMPEAVHRVDSEDQRDVQAGVLDRVLLDHVVLVGPVVAGVTGVALAGRIRRVVRAAREQRANVVVDQPRVHAALVQLRPALAAAFVGRAGQVVDELLVHLADLLLERHPVEQVVNAVLNRRLLIEVARRTTGRGRRRSGQGCDRECGKGNPDCEQGATHRSPPLSEVCESRSPALSGAREAAATMSGPMTRSGRSLLVAPRIQATGSSSHPAFEYRRGWFPKPRDGSQAGSLKEKR